MLFFLGLSMFFMGLEEFQENKKQTVGYSLSFLYFRYLYQ
jgi:hypothetical protein